MVRHGRRDFAALNNILHPDIGILMKYKHRGGDTLCQSLGAVVTRVYASTLLVVMG